MSQNQLRLDGLSELMAALRELPADLAEEAAELVDDTVERTAASLYQSYPRGDTGNLRKGIKKSVQRSQFGVSGDVKSTSPHAHLWEFPTVNRRTRQGWNRGRVPGHYNQGLVGIALRERRALFVKLKAIVARAGFAVSGDF